MAALTDRLRKAKPADPEALYEVVESFAVGGTVYQRGAKMRGDHPAVSTHRALFMPDGLDDLQKAAARRDYWAASYAQETTDTPPPPPPPRAVRPTGGMRAVRTFRVEERELGGPQVVNAGQIVDAGSELYRAFPHLFVMVVEERS